MRVRVICWLLTVACVLCLTACAGASESQTPSTGNEGDNVVGDTQYAKIRKGLPNTYAKLVTEKELVIAYIGGSITAGASAENVSKESYRSLTTAWFEQQFPDAAITEINLGFGSAGSKLPAYYVKTELVPRRPDLIFLECAINDYIERGTVSLSEVEAQYETVIRQLRIADPTCEFVALYTTNAEVSATDEFFEQAAAQDAVAKHYGIPSINIGRQLRMRYGLRESKQNGQLTQGWKRVFVDDVHPNSEGHAFYAACITDVLESVLLNNMTTPNAVISEYALPSAKSQQLLMDVQYIKADKIDLSASPEWQYDAASGSIYATKTDSELTLTFTGTGLTFDCSGLPFGEITRASVSVDGGEWQSLQPRMIRAVPIVTGLNKGVHTLRFRCGTVSENSAFRIMALMVR